MVSKIKENANRIAGSIAAYYLLVQARATSLYCSDAFTEAEGAVTNLQAKLVSLAEVLFPLAIVICGVCMFFTRDQKKFDQEKSILIGCCLAFALIVLVDKGHLVTTIQSLF